MTLSPFGIYQSPHGPEDFTFTLGDLTVECRVFSLGDWHVGLFVGFDLEHCRPLHIFPVSMVHRGQAVDYCRELHARFPEWVTWDEDDLYAALLEHDL